MNKINELSLDGILKDVLIKQIGGNTHDLVFVVSELPRSLFYTKAWKKVPKMDRDGYPTGNLISSRTEKILGLKPGIKFSQTGDKGFVFDSMSNEGRERLAELDRFIFDTLPPNATIPHREAYCREPGNMTSPPRAKHELPRVEMPVSSPPVEVKTSTVSASPSNLLVKRSKRK